MESTSQVQCDEISSTGPEPSVLIDVMTYKRNPREWQRGEASNLRALARQLIDEKVKNTSLSYSWKDEDTAIIYVNDKKIRVYRNPRNTVEVRFVSLVYANITSLSALQVACLLLETIFETFNYTFETFAPVSARVSEEFKIPQKLKLGRICAYSSKENTEEVMNFWMPYVESTEIVNIGDILNAEHEARCFRILHKHFLGKVEGWIGMKVPVTTANALRRLMPVSMVDGDGTPIGTFMRWIKGSLTNTPGYTHIKYLCYRTPLFKPHTGLLRFLGCPVGAVHSDVEYLIPTADGRVALFHFYAGIIRFKYYTDPPEDFVEKNWTFNFGLDDLADDDEKWPEYLEKDRIDYQNVKSYAVLPTPEPEAPQQ